jgi:alpha-1,6-mannosyltransferase
VAFVAACGAASLGDLSAHVPVWLLWLGLGALPLLIALAGGRPPRKTLRIVLFWALLIRLPLLLGTEPTLSDDVFRYVWEGRVVAEGFDPYDLAPDAPTLATVAVDAEEWSSINHKELPAIYPAGTQWVFAVIAAASPSSFTFRAVMVSIDLLLIIAIGLLLAGRGLDPRALALYAWHPLVAVEVASSGHYEPLALLPLVAGLLAWDRARNGALPWMLWGLAIATKYVGGAAGWFAARELLREGRTGRAVLGLAISGLAAVALAMPFFFDGTPPVGSLGTYVEHWGHNGSVHALLTPVIGYHPARYVVAVVFLGWAGWLTWRGGDVARSFLLLFAGLVVLSPVVHPWYGLWLIALLPLFPSVPLLAFSVLLPLSYLAWTEQAAGGAWAVPGWVPWLEYGLPLVLALGLQAARRRR